MSAAFIESIQHVVNGFVKSAISSSFFEMPLGYISDMTDRDLLNSLGLKTVEAAKILGVPFQALYRAIPSSQTERGRIPARRSGPKGRVVKPYLHIGRLVIIWLHFIKNGKHELAALLWEEIFCRNPEVGAKLGHFRRRIKTGEFAFTEVWIFSKRPFEIDAPDLSEEMRGHLSRADRRLVYFVPSRSIAQNLHATLASASRGTMREVFIVISNSVSMSPHWAVVFDPPGDENLFVGVPPRGPKGPPTWADWEELPETDFLAVRDVLNSVGLLDVRGRFRLPRTVVVGGGAFPDFEIYFPERA